VLLERVVELAVVGDGRSLGQMVVGVALVRLGLDRARIRPLEMLDRVHGPLAVVLQQLAELLGVHRAHADLAFADSRRSSSSASSPPRETSLSRAPCPETSVTERRGTSSVSAISRRTASFARPSSAGAETRTFQPSPYGPTSSDRLAPDETRRRSTADGVPTA